MTQKQSQKQRLLEHLQLYGNIDPLEGWFALGIYRLSAVIFILKKDGHNIVTERKIVKNRFGEECEVANYIFKQPEMVTPDLFQVE
jgi:hypothetical protein